MTNKDKDYDMEINYEQDEIVLQLKGATDEKVYFIQTLVYDEGVSDYVLKSWQLLI